MNWCDCNVAITCRLRTPWTKQKRGERNQNNTKYAYGCKDSREEIGTIHQIRITPRDKGQHNSNDEQPFSKGETKRKRKTRTRWHTRTRVAPHPSAKPLPQARFWLGLLQVAQNFFNFAFVSIWHRCSASLNSSGHSCSASM